MEDSVVSSIDQQFVEYVVRSLVSKPDAVKIERRIDEKGVLLELTVDPEDLGRVIGKRGATAQSLRTLLRALGTKNDARYNLKIVDNGEPMERRYNSTPPERQDEVERKDDELIESNTKEDQDSGVETELPLEKETKEEPPISDRYSKTRQELEDLDDLDL
jgi:predicted RNA-binding protein YlqC (UPF0109 family)